MCSSEGQEDWCKRESYLSESPFRLPDLVTQITLAIPGPDFGIPGICLFKESEGIVILRETHHAK